jgi:hypothetical protein
MTAQRTLLAALACSISVSASAQTPIEQTFSSSLGAHGFLLPGGSSVPALRGFDVRYTNGDHQIRDMYLSLWNRGDYAVILKDSSGVDPIAGTIKLMDVQSLGSYRYRLTKTDCVGTCRINLPWVVPREYALVLIGFDVHYSTEDGGPDTNIRELSVDPFPQNAYINVRFGDSSGRTPYHAQLDFTFVRSTYLSLYDRRVSSPVPVRGSQTVMRTPGEALLQGFSLRFTESDHFLERFGVDLTGNRIAVWFHDRDRNDPFVWSVKYALLR